MEESDGSVVASELELAASELASERERAPATEPVKDQDELIHRLMREHGNDIYAYCLKQLRDRALAEDVMQQVFIAAHRDFHKFRHNSSVATWLSGIARHRCQDAIKSRGRREKWISSDDDALLGIVDLYADPRSEIELGRVRAWLQACLDTLTADSRDALLMRFHAGLSYEEMAQRSGEKSDTLRARVTRALPLMRKCLESKGWDGE